MVLLLVESICCFRCWSASSKDNLFLNHVSPSSCVKDKSSTMLAMRCCPLLQGDGLQYAQSLSIGSGFFDLVLTLMYSGFGYEKKIFMV